MTEAELQAIEARANAATEGPWERSDWEVVGGGWAIGRQSRDLIYPDPIPPVQAVITMEPDADFIAAARTDIPALVAEVRHLRGILAGVEDSGCGCFMREAAACPCCRGEVRGEEVDHRSDCELAAAIRPGPPKG